MIKKKYLLCLMLLGVQAQAQSVFKCSVDGKTVYQSAPCAGQGKALEIAQPPSEQDAAEARMRADREMSQGAAAGSSALNQQSRQQARNTQAARSNERAAQNCATLSKQRANAYGTRNSIIHDARQFGGNVNNSSSVDRAVSEIARTERAMQQNGCKFD